VDDYKKLNVHWTFVWSKIHTAVEKIHLNPFKYFQVARTLTVVFKNGLEYKLHPIIARSLTTKRRTTNTLLMKN